VISCFYVFTSEVAKSVLRLRNLQVLEHFACGQFSIFHQRFGGIYLKNRQKQVDAPVKVYICAVFRNDAFGNFAMLKLANSNYG